MTWTQFWDMHSGGGQKLEWPMIYIEAPEAEARSVFYARFGRNPGRVTCTCCGEDYSVSEEPSLARLTGFHRGCVSLETPRDAKGLYKEPDDPWFKEHYYLERGEEAEAVRRGYAVSDRSSWKEYRTLEEYVKSPDVKVIRADEIAPSERNKDVPEEGYVWQ